MESESSPFANTHDAIESAEELAIDLAGRLPALARPLATVAAELASCRGLMEGNGTSEGDLHYLRRVVDAVHPLLVGLDATNRKQVAVGGVTVRELLVDLLEMAPDEEHGVYPGQTIEELRERARRLLIDG